MSPPPQPLRLGIIGLSSTATTSWAAAAHLPNLVTPAGRQHYTITALCNSSEPAAHAAIAAFSLDPATTHAHGTPESLAADPTVDVVACSTRVDTHVETLLPSVRAGRPAYVEWPVASTPADAAALEAAAHDAGVRVAVGLQRRWAPPVLKLAEVLRSGRLGRLLSSDVRAFGGVVDRASLPSGLRYFAQRDVGGNPIVIGFGHVIDFVQSVVGELDPATTHAQLQIQRPAVAIVDPKTREPLEHARSDVPDLISVHGTLPGSAAVTPGATLTAQFRTGQPFPGAPALQWTLNCERGELRFVARAGLALQADAPADAAQISLHDFATDRVEDVPWAWSAEQAAVPLAARHVQPCLYAFAAGDEGGYVGIADGVRRLRQIHGWLAQTPVPRA